MPENILKKGRPTLYDERMLPNGLLPNVNEWYKQEAKRRGLKNGTALRRKVLVEFMQRVESQKKGE